MNTIRSVIKEETIYIINESVLDTFEALLNEHPHVKAYIGDVKRGYIFQIRLIFDTYHFLTTPKEELLTDSYRIFERPVNTFFHEIFCKQQELQTFKLVNQKQRLLCLLVSIFLTKKLVAILYDYSESKTVDITYESLLELFNPTDQEITPLQQQCIIQLQTNTLRTIKQAEISYDEIVLQAITEAREIYNFMIGVRKK